MTVLLDFPALPTRLWYLNLRLLVREAKRLHVYVLISQIVLFWTQTNLLKGTARLGMMAHARNSNTRDAEARHERSSGLRSGWDSSEFQASPD